MFSGVPCYYLAKLHEQVKDDMPKPRTLIGIWREMRLTWRLQQDDPDYQFNTPLPPTERLPVTHAAEAMDDDSLVVSIGYLTPTSLRQIGARLLACRK